MKRTTVLPDIYRLLLAAYGPQKCFLVHRNPYELLVATVLSAQCTDKRVNAVTPALFAVFPDPAALAAAEPARLEALIHSCGFFRAKGANLRAAARTIVERFGGRVPATMDELLTLPGVGRKTANVLLGDAFGLPGFPVDTHVKRLADRIGLSASDDPAAIESDLCAQLPPDQWAQASHLLILHGRTRCPARKPDCANCGLAVLCRYGSAALHLKRKTVRS